MDVKLLEEYGFDFGAYGCKLMDEQNIRFTPYGFIRHPRGQELSMAREQEQRQEQEQTPEPEQTFEPTMGM